MERLKIAQQHIRTFMSERLYLKPLPRGVPPHEIEALAKLREALALIVEADYAIAKAEASAYKLRRNHALGWLA